MKWKTARVCIVPGLALFVSLECGTLLKGDTITGVFSNPVLAGSILNTPSVGQTTYFDNSNSAVFGTATPGGASCAPSNVLCWGTAPDLMIPASQQYSQLVFTGSTAFNGLSAQNQLVGTISYLNGTSDIGSEIFGATLSFYDNGSFIGADNVIITTTSNQFSGTSFTQAQLQEDADYINICGNNSNICNSSIEAYEDSQGGTGVLVDLTGNLVFDPTLMLNSVTLDPSQQGCTTCGAVGNNPAVGNTVPEPAPLTLIPGGLILFAGLVFRRGERHTAS
jgi:hypothetical protein